MKIRTLVLSALLSAKLLKPSFAQSSAPIASISAAEHAHVVNSFRFEVAAPMERVAPLFAPEAERSWAGDYWKPIFRYPEPGRDVPGAVWTIRHGQLNSVWVNTLFDLMGGRIQYVAMIPDHFVTIIDVHVTASSPAHTAIDVIYTRTALDPAANENVSSLGQSDRASGPEWQHGIESALGLAKK